MTKARKLKKQIRARARKTGESYTAARLKVLKHKARASTDRLPAALLRREPRLVEKTGRGWQHWFSVLDRFGAKEKGHTAAARHVAEDHGVDGWYAQAITVEYERARGLRAANQRMSGAYEVAVSKVLPAPVSSVVRALRDPGLRTSWAGALDPELRSAFEAAVTGPKGLRERDRGDARMRIKAASGVTVDLYLDPTPNGKSRLVAQSMKLAVAADVDRYRAAWKQAFTALGRQLEG
jgi:hypothetical protein